VLVTTRAQQLELPADDDTNLKPLQDIILDLKALLATGTIMTNLIEDKAKSRKAGAVRKELAMIANEKLTEKVPAAVRRIADLAKDSWEFGWVKPQKRQATLASTTAVAKAKQ